MGIIDIRQSDNWSTYQKNYGWKSHKLSSGIIVRTTNILFFKIAKLHRPAPLNIYDLNELNNICKENKIIHLKISPHPKQDLGLLQSFGYKKSQNVEITSKTSYINLENDENALWKNLTGGCRTSITKSLKAQDATNFIKNPSNQQLEACHKTVKAGAKNRGVFLFGVNDFKQKADAFGSETFIGNVFAKNGELLGTKLFLGFNGAIWGMHAGTTKLGKSSSGGYKLLWDSFNYFKKLGYTTMDLEGLADDRFKKLTSHWKGYTFYKLQFGGKIVEFPLPYSKFFFK